MTEKIIRPSKPPANAGADSAKPDPGRRAFFKAAVKGAAIGVPSIVTLTSGSAWAASIDCWHRQYNGYTLEPVGTTGKYLAIDPATGKPVDPSAISEFCWNSGGILQTGHPWSDLTGPT